MIAREIRKHSYGVIQFITTMKVHRLGRAFHHRRLASDGDGLAQQPLHVGGFGRRAVRLRPLLAQSIFDRTRHGGRLAGRFGNRRNQIRASCFPICSRDAD